MTIAALPSTLTIGDLPTYRLGFGAMRLPDQPAADRAESVAILRHAIAAGVTFIDTADAYDLGENEKLVAEALHPYANGLIVATKGGQCHPGNEWIPLGRPEYLRQQAQLSLRRLRVDRIDLYQLHRVDPTVPLADQIGALRQLQDEGKIRHVGLSEVTIDQLREAQTITPIVSVQNRYNLADRRSDPVLNYCEQHAIAFIPWLPVQPSVRDTSLNEIATRLGATRVQVALAWLLRRSPTMLPIPGTSSRAHLDENLAAATLTLSDEDYAALS